MKLQITSKVDAKNATNQGTNQLTQMHKYLAMFKGA